MTWLWVCGLCAAMLPALADAHVMNTRPKMAVQYSGKGGASAEKYFREFPSVSTLGSLDIRSHMLCMENQTNLRK